MKADGEQNKKKTDVLLVHGTTKKRDGYRVIRARDGNLEMGEMRSVKEGEPIQGEVVKLTPREEHRRLFDVEVLAPREETLPSTRSGPAQVATENYRQNWEAVFRQPRKAQLLN